MLHHRKVREMPKQAVIVSITITFAAKLRVLDSLAKIVTKIKTQRLDYIVFGHWVSLRSPVCDIWVILGVHSSVSAVSLEIVL
jgi:hypothetical protein